MVTSHEIDAIVDTVFKKTKADELELTVLSNHNELTRYANSKIHQNVAQRDNSISLRVVFGKKVGSASTNRLNEAGVLKALNKAESIAKHQREDPHFKGLPEDVDRKTKNLDSYCKETAECSPEERAKRVKDIVDYAGDEGVDRVYGSLSTSVMSLFVANTNGIRRSEEITKANLTVTTIADWDNDQGFGWGESCNADIDKIEHRKVVELAVQKGLNNLNPKKIDPGEYTVVLEPLAVNTLFTYLSFMGFSGKSVQEQRSFMNGKFGEQLMDERVTMVDDAGYKDMMGFSFDFEGVPKKRVEMIKNGVAKDVVYDSYTAGKENNKESTGHALPMPNSMGPMTMNLVLEGGDSNIEEMIKETDKGILVTRFNYCRPVHPVKSILTGLTRDGTWMIEDGEVQYPLKNLRFTQNLLDAFTDVEEIGTEQVLFGMDYYPLYTLSPSMKIPKFNFTGTTEF